MKFLLALLAVSVLGVNSDQAIAPINHTAWVDIGAGRSLSDLKPAEIARLRRCDGASMYFEHWSGRSFDQVFMTGISMRSTFERAERTQSGNIIMLFRTAKSAKPDETIYLSSDGGSLTQVAPPASPHVYLRCESPEIKMR